MTPLKRILVVADNDLLARALVLALVNEGHVVENASSAADALALAPSFVPDAAIVNLSLPDMTGDELARRLRGAFATVRLVGIAGSPSSTLPIARRAAFDAIVEKPFVVGDILQAI